MENLTIKEVCLFWSDLSQNQSQSMLDPEVVANYQGDQVRLGAICSRSRKIEPKLPL